MCASIECLDVSTRAIWDEHEEQGLNFDSENCPNPSHSSARLSFFADFAVV
ncbi:MAG: hypothetical protein U5R06_19685 [candidate division KSB1 bacterium]|nr:hypothetical protein [candidate division KSB1 bacterium]